MSYSFQIMADTKEDATRQVREQFDNIVLAQPTHIVDKEAVIVAAQNFIRLLADPDKTTEIYVDVYGSVSWRWEGDPTVNEYTAANVSISTCLRPKN